jgi:hypothetical protein
MEIAHLTRRRFISALRLGAVLPAASLVSGCGVFEAFFRNCPENLTTGGVDWIPDVLHPVFYGYNELATAGGAPGPVRIWYPSYDGTPADAPILPSCVARWPLVLFLHGQPPCSQLSDYYLHWEAIPRILARSGYVVVQPSYSATIPAALAADAWPLTLMDWVRSGWQHARWVDPRPQGTAVVGHSYGALLGARVVDARPQISSFVSLGGPWAELDREVGPVLRGLHSASFFMSTPTDDIRAGGLWNLVAPPKYHGFYSGEHFDYIPDEPNCDELRGDCPLISIIAADLVALFITRYTRVPLARARIPANLDPPPVALSSSEETFSGGQISGSTRRLSGLTSFDSDIRCHIDLTWNLGGGDVSRRIGRT